MTDLQKTELEILRSFISVCERLGLTYYLVCGSALGAVKYKGFIPWDDDVDVALPREDFTVFLKKAPALMPDHYFIQTYSSDPHYPGIICKIRDSETTFIEKSVKDLKINHGVYIDVFPLDGYPNNKSDARRFERKKFILKLKLSSANTLTSDQKPLTRLFFRLEKLLGFDKRTAKYSAKLDALAASFPASESEIWCNHGNWQGSLEYAPRSQYGKGAFEEFEGMRVRVPERYDEYLTQKYGDWRADLPDEEKKGHHFCTVCDTDRPYTDYC